MEIRLVKQSELPTLAKMVQETYRKSFEFFYPKSWIDYTVKRQTPERFLEKAKTMNFYVARHKEESIGCACVGQYNNLDDECVIVSFCVAHKWQGKGIGKALMKMLEQDEVYLRSRRVEVASSLNALPFYLKNGFVYKNNEMVFDYGSFHLEKFLR